MHWTSLRWRRLASAAVLVLGGAAVATSQAPRQPAVPPGPAGLWISDSPAEQGGRLLVVVDTATRRAAVYHVDGASGSLALKSARDLTWDLSLDEFNTAEPRPAAIRRLLDAAPPGPPPRGP